MAQTHSLLMLLCAALALSGVAGSSRGFSRQLTSCTSHCSTMLGSAVAFGVMAASTVSNDGPTKVDGNLGLTPGTSISGFPPGTVTGNSYVGGAVSKKASDDAITAYAELVAMPHNESAVLSGQDLVGMTLTAGKYYFAAGAELRANGNLTFDAQGNASAIFVIQTKSTFTTFAKTNILLINGAKACNVFYAVGSSATIGKYSVVRGSIVAYTSVTLMHAVEVHGAVIAVHAAVTLDDNLINSPATCNWSGGNRPVHHHPAPAPPGSN